MPGVTWCSTRCRFVCIPEQRLDGRKNGIQFVLLPELNLIVSAFDFLTDKGLILLRDQKSYFLAPNTERYNKFLEVCIVDR